jgi:hypothetical protein
MRLTQNLVTENCIEEHLAGFGYEILTFRKLSSQQLNFGPSYCPRMIPITRACTVQLTL